MLLRYSVPVASLIALILFTSAGLADDPIKEIVDAKPNAAIFRNATLNRPLVLRSKSDAGKHFVNNQLEKLQQHVNFEKQIVLVFAWRGSGQDKLTYEIAESFPEQIFFRSRPGRTRDLRPHIHVYVLRSNVVWRTPDGNNGIPKKLDLEDYIRVEVRGKLNSQVMAIGGETTGVTISAKGVTWELELDNDQGLRRQAKQLHGKTVVVKGDLTLKKGVEIRERWIVNVKSLIDTESATNSNQNPRNRK